MLYRYLYFISNTSYTLTTVGATVDACVESTVFVAIAKIEAAASTVAIESGEFAGVFADIALSMLLDDTASFTCAAKASTRPTRSTR